MEQAGQRFAGFSKDAFAFFKSLGANNNREWFHAHKDAYERSCRDPLKALTTILDPPLGASRLTRINRDMRFSKDKTPYRTHISTGVHGNYLSLSSEGLYVGTGLYMPDPPMLRRLREAVDQDTSGRKLVEIVKALRRKGYTVGSHDTLAKTPRGFRVDHPRSDLLRMKDIHAGKIIMPSALSSPAKAVERVRRVCADVAPLKGWLQRHVGSGGQRDA